MSVGLKWSLGPILYDKCPSNAVINVDKWWYQNNLVQQRHPLKHKFPLMIHKMSCQWCWGNCLSMPRSIFLFSHIVVRMKGEKSFFIVVLLIYFILLLFNFLLFSLAWNMRNSPLYKKNKKVDKIWSINSKHMLKWHGLDIWDSFV